MRNLENLDWKEILNKLSEFCTSEAGKELALLTSKKSSPNEAEKSFFNTMDALALISTGIRPHMESLDLYSLWSIRLKKNAVLKTLEIKDLRLFCLEIIALKQAASEIKNTWCEQVSNSLMDAEEPLSAIDQVITGNGEIRSDASEKLYNLYTEKNRLERELHSSLESLVKSNQIENYIQDKFVTTRDGRWVLPIKSGMQHFVPGVIHSASQSKQTVFIEPERVIPINNRLRKIEVEIEEEIEKILTELSHYLYTKFSQFEACKEVLTFADYQFAIAQLTQKLDAKPVQFSTNKLELFEIKHPLLVLAGKDVISNTVQLSENSRIIILSGLNAGGKTVLLKSIGLASQMARCGIPVCASEQSQIPFFNEIHTGIGDSQNVDSELSTFAAHLKILNSAAELSGLNNLILIDEICGSTDPDEGSALARGFIETFAENKVFAVITSHLGPLKMGWENNSHVINGSLEYDKKTGRPTYQFIPGVAGESLAIMTAQRVGVNKEIVNRAIKLLSPEAQAKLNFNQQYEKKREEIASLQKELKSQIHKQQELKSKYEKLIQEFNKEKNSILEKELSKANKKVEEAIALAKAEETFKKHSALQDIKYNLPQIIKASQGTPETTQKVVDSSEEFAKRFPPGSKVFVPSLNQDGIIQSAPNSKGEVLILSSSLRLQISWRELKLPTNPANPTAQIVRQKSNAIHIALDESDRTLDIRGKRIEEALEELEMELDKAVQNKETRIKVIHGHGTEVLKKAVRAYLSRSVYVKKWKSAPPDHGGDGVTWIEIE